MREKMREKKKKNVGFVEIEVLNVYEEKRSVLELEQKALEMVSE